MSKLSHSFIKLNTISADSGNYTMYINTDGVESSCQAGVYFYSKLNLLLWFYSFERLGGLMVGDMGIWLAYQEVLGSIFVQSPFNVRCIYYVVWFASVTLSISPLQGMATPTFKFLKAELEETWIPMVRYSLIYFNVLKERFSKGLVYLCPI